jgi:thiol-disulfide isomerase/thioredoxin
VKRAHAWALFAAVAAASVAGGAGYHWWSRESAVAESRAAVERVYATRLADLKGDAQPLAQWRGKVLVVNFWATWCAPCREEIPVFVRLQERHGPRGLTFVGIAIDQPDKVASFAQEFRINYPMLIGNLETLELLRQVGNKAGVLPYTLVIDREGKLVTREPGGLKENKLEAILKPLL